MSNIPAITKNLLIINVLAFIASWVLERAGIDLASLCGLHFFMASDFHVFQLVTYMFLHGNLMHILFNMFALWMFGCVIERVWGPRKFLFYYLSCGIGAGLMQELTQAVQFYVLVNSQFPGIAMSALPQVAHNNADMLNMWNTVGASGAVYAILLAFGMTFPNEKMFVIPIPVPIKAKWLVMGYVVIEFASAMGSSGDGIAHMAHLGGMLFGFFMIRYWNRHPYGGYNSDGGRQFFDGLKNRFDSYRRQRRTGSRDTSTRSSADTRRESDWEYNARKKARQEEVDRILDKVRKSGYDSLTKEEKQRLFDSSNDY